MKQFEIGKKYEPYGSGFAPVTVTRRTAKTVWVTNGQNEWRMKVRQNANGDEYAVDSSVPTKWRDEFTYSSLWKVAG